MVVLERSPGQEVRVGPYTLRVLAIRADEVLFALSGEEECPVCGVRSAELDSCPVCGAIVVACAVCRPGRRCPGCG